MNGEEEMKSEGEEEGDLRALYWMIEAGNLVFGFLKQRKWFVGFAAKWFLFRFLLFS